MNMSISTKKGDSGYTGTLRGKRIPKYHLITEAVGAIDESNSLVGLARAFTESKRIKRILLQIQKQLLIVGAELSASDGGRPPKKTISESDVRWLEKLTEQLEEVLELPPGFVAFGQKGSASQLDVARTSIRKAERIVVKMHSNNMIGNTNLLRFLNRLSDLIFVIACFEEKDMGKKHISGKRLFAERLSDPAFRNWTILSGLIVVFLTAIIILGLIFHRPGSEIYPGGLKQHVEEMGSMHNSVDITGHLK